MSLHAHRSRLAQDRERRIGRWASQQFRSNAQRLIGGVTDAEHPLIAAHRAHAAPHLIGQRLEPQPVIRLGQRARHGLARPLRGLCPQEDVDRLLEAPLQQMGIPFPRDETLGLQSGLQRDVKAMDSVEEKERTHAFVEVVAGAAEGIQAGALRHQLGQRR